LTVAKTLSGFPIELELPGTTREPEMYPVACKKTHHLFLSAAFLMLAKCLARKRDAFFRLPWCGQRRRT
jgi:hypothetical protein